MEIRDSFLKLGDPDEMLEFLEEIKITDNELENVIVKLESIRDSEGKVDFIENDLNSRETLVMGFSLGIGYAIRNIKNKT